MALSEEDLREIALKTGYAADPATAGSFAPGYDRRALAVDMGDVDATPPIPRKPGQTETQALLAAGAHPSAITAQPEAAQHVMYEPQGPAVDVPMPQGAPLRGLAPGGQVVPAGWQSTARQIQEGQPLSPEEQAATQEYRLARRAEGEAQIAKDEQQTRIDAMRARQQADFAIDQEHEEYKRRSAQDAEMAAHRFELEDALEQIRKTPPIDQDRWWHSKSTGDKVRIGLAMILGGIGAGILRQPNQVAGMINKQIDNDIDAQKAEYEKKRGTFEAAKTMYGLAAQKWAHEDQRALGARVMAKESLLAQIDARTAELQDPAQQARAAQTRAAVAKDLEADVLKLHDATADKIVRHEAWRPAGMVGGGGEDPVKAYHRYTEEQLKQGMTPMNFDSWFATAWKGTQGGFSQERKGGAGKVDPKMADQAAAAQEVLSINKRLRELLGKKGPLSAAEREEVNRLSDQGALHFPRMMTRSTRINKEELAKGEEVYASKGDWLKTDALGRRGAALDTMDRMAKEQLQQAQQAGASGGSPATVEPEAPSGFRSDED